MKKTKIIKCKICGKEKEVNSSKVNAKFCSRKCQYIAKRGNKVQRKLIHCASCGKEILVYSNDFRRKYCNTVCKNAGLKNIKFSADRKRNISEKTKQAMHSICVRQKHLDGITEHFNAHPNSTGVYKTGLVSLIRLEKNVRFRSSLEERGYLLFDSMPSIVNIDVEKLRIEYVTDKIHYYIPDCVIELITGEKVIVEIKTKNFINESLNLIKFNAARKFAKSNCYYFCVMTENNLLSDNSVETTLSEVIQTATANIQKMDDDIVRTVAMEKLQKQAEMTCSPKGENYA